MYPVLYCLLSFLENRDAPSLAQALLMGAAVLARRELAVRAGVAHLPTAVAAMKPTNAWLALGTAPASALTW